MEICTGDHSIKQIFQHNGNWDAFRNKHFSLIRPAVIENVNKVLACKTEALGFHQYVCPECGESKKIPHTCKSRFCSSCGKIAVDNWVQTSISKFPDIQYRHIVFTLPEQLRMVCIMNRKLMLNALFKLAAYSIISWAKENKIVPRELSPYYTPSAKRSNSTITSISSFPAEGFLWITPLGSRLSSSRKKSLKPDGNTTSSPLSAPLLKRTSSRSLNP